MGGKVKNKKIVSVALPVWEAEYIQAEAKRLRTTSSSVLKAIIEVFIMEHAPVLKSRIGDETGG